MINVCKHDPLKCRTFKTRKGFSMKIDSQEKTEKKAENKSKHNCELLK